MEENYLVKEILVPIYYVDGGAAEPMKKFLKEFEFLTKITDGITYSEFNDMFTFDLYLDEMLVKLPTIKEFIKVYNNMMQKDEKTPGKLNPGIGFNLYQFTYTKDDKKYGNTCIIRGMELDMFIIAGTYVKCKPVGVPKSHIMRFHKFENITSIEDFGSEEEKQRYKNLGERLLQGENVSSIREELEKFGGRGYKVVTGQSTVSS